ncbi:hypothetical protein [Salinisphaera sp. T31B1]|uniref:phage head-tail joining protein n=1 Tax=Salinisphaera sp. T31B1 TaxID=727963 RepID=UPI00334076EF
MALTEAEKVQRQEWLNELEEARASGATRIRYRDRDVTFRSLDELDRLIGEARRELACQTRRRRPRTFAVYSRKGVY